MLQGPKEQKKEREKSANLKKKTYLHSFGGNWTVQNVNLLGYFLLGFFLSLFKQIITTVYIQMYILLVKGPAI